MPEIQTSIVSHLGAERVRGKELLDIGTIADLDERVCFIENNIPLLKDRSKPSGYFHERPIRSSKLAPILLKRIQKWVPKL